MIQAKRIESAVDYLTAVTLHPKTTSVMLGRAERLARSEERKGNLIKPWGMAGFDGLQVGQLQLGSRGSEGIVRLSGGLAALEWFEFYQDCDQPTRIDIQETYRMPKDPTKWIATGYLKVKRWADEHQPNLKVRIIRGRDNACTCYIGSRKSDVFTRLYNKEVESKQEVYKSCARVETEFKGRQAKLVGRQLTSGEVVQTVIHTRLSQILSKYHCHLPTQAETGQLTTGNCYQRSPDALRAYTWLFNSTRNSVRIVIDKLGPCKLREALGLTTEDLLDMLECRSPGQNQKEGN